MKVIDLLNKIANGEEVPKKIKYNDLEYELDKEQDDYMLVYAGLLDDINTFNQLNDEVEIIEEDKKIEMLPMIEEDELYVAYLEINQTRRKINEIIDYINKENK